MPKVLRRQRVYRCCIEGYALRALGKSDHIEQTEQVTSSAAVSKMLPLVLAQLRNALDGRKSRSKTLVED